MTAAFPPPPPNGPPPALQPPGDPRSNGSGWVLVLLGGLLVTAALVAGVALLWPDGDDGPDTVESVGTTILEPLDSTRPPGDGEPSRTTSPGAVVPTRSVDLFDAGAQDAYRDLVRAAGAKEVLQVLVYPEYAFLAYRDPAQPSHIDERQWRGDVVGGATPNTGDDRYDADTKPKLFAARALSLADLPRLVDDAASRFGVPVDITHVIVDRFLPFDQRVLIRVYGSPQDGRSGGGYVQYTVDGAYVKTIQ